MKYEDTSIRQTNHRIIEQDNDCRNSIQEIRAIEQFWSDFGYLSFGRDIAFCRNNAFSLQVISTSLELTAGSIYSCCESGCIADAHSLLRKYRDDMFFYLYIKVYDANKKLGHTSQQISQMEENIEHWINNNLCDLSIGSVMQAIGQSTQAREAVKKYNLQVYFNTIADRLNNYVHSNGVSYYNRNVNAYHGNGLQLSLQTLLMDMRFITITFLFLLTLCSPLSIMSTDYVDCLDGNMTPPESSQYWVAPFITEFFKNNLDLIEKNCIDYLRENTPMEIE